MSQVIRSKTVTTRKDHKCFGCYGTIPKGTAIEVSTCIGDGTVYDVRICDECNDWLSNHNFADYFDDEGFLKGEIKTARAECGCEYCKNSREGIL